MNAIPGKILTCFIIIKYCIIYAAISVMDLIHHIQTVHNLKIEVNKLQFTSIAEFKTWKEEEESHSNYVQECAPQSSSTKQTWYYYCNRSGVNRETGKGIRNTKRQGSCKTGQRCTAHMKLVNDTEIQVRLLYIIVVRTTTVRFPWGT